MSCKYLMLRNGYYYVRIKIPSDIQHHFPSKELKKSLKTSDLRSARRLASQVLQKAEKTFVLLRLQVVEDDHARQVAGELVGQRKEDTRVLSLAEAVEVYTRENEKGWSAKTKIDYRGTFKMIVDLAGDVKLTGVTREVVKDLRDKMAMLPPNVYKSHPTQHPLEVLNLEHPSTMAASSINKNLSRLSALMKFCVREGYIPSNPAEGVTIADVRRDDEERKAYDPEDLQRIVGALQYDADTPERYWIPLIGMHSGMRLDEICQLYVEDVREIDGVWCFDVNGQRDKKLKTSSSERVVPVHPILVDIGFLRYVEGIRGRQLPRLWMNLRRREADGYGSAFGKWYQRFNRQHVTTDPLKVFHSFRHTFTDTLKQKGVAENVISELVGHAVDSITMSRYGKRYQPRVLLEGLRQLEYGIHDTPNILSFSQESV